MIRTITSFLPIGSFQIGWNSIPNLPKAYVPTLKKVALIVTALGFLYEIYKAYQSLQDRITKLETKLGTQNTTIAALRARVEELKPHKGQLEQANKQITTLGARVQTLERQLQARTDNPTDFVSDNTDDEYQDCPEDDDTTTPSTTIPGSPSDSTPAAAALALPLPTPTIVAAAKPPIELFREKFPGKNFNIEMKGNKTTVGDYLLQEVLRINEVVQCTFDGTSFELQYASERVITIARLPPSVEIPPGIQWILNIVMGRKVQLPANIKGYISTDASDANFTFDSIHFNRDQIKVVYPPVENRGMWGGLVTTFQQNVWRLEAQLLEIRFHTPKGVTPSLSDVELSREELISKHKHLFTFIRSEHNIPRLNKKEDHAWTYQVMEGLDVNLHPEDYPQSPSASTTAASERASDE